MKKNYFLRISFWLLAVAAIVSCSSDQIDIEKPLDIDIVYSDEVKDFSNNLNFKELLLPYSDGTADCKNFFPANVRIAKQSEFADNKFAQIFNVKDVLPQKGTGSIYTFENGNKIINNYIEESRVEFDKIIAAKHDQINYDAFLESISTKKNVFIFFDENSKSELKDAEKILLGKDSVKVFRDMAALKNEIYRAHSEIINAQQKASSPIKFTVLFNPFLVEKGEEAGDSIKVNLILLSPLSNERKGLALEGINHLTKGKGILTLNVITKSNNYQKRISLKDSLQYFQEISSEMNVNEFADRTTLKVIFNDILTKTEKDSIFNYFFILGDLKHTTTINLSNWKPLQNSMFIFGTNKHEFVEAFKTVLRMKELKFSDLEKFKEVL